MATFGWLDRLDERVGNQLGSLVRHHHERRLSRPRMAARHPRARERRQLVVCTSTGSERQPRRGVDRRRLGSS
ncbi:MAG: hypothetical protein WKF73_02995 [Nocardioidaceae bacterium]